MRGLLLIVFVCMLAVVPAMAQQVGAESVSMQMITASTVTL